MAACQDFLQTVDQSDEEEYVDEEDYDNHDGVESGAGGDGDNFDDDGSCDDDGDGSFSRMTRRLFPASGLLIRSGEFEFGFGSLGEALICVWAQIQDLEILW